MDQGILIARLVFGLVMAAHGSQKLFGWFGGYGLTGTGGFLETIGFKPGRLFAAAAGAGEFFGGLLVALGLLGPIGPALVLSVMIVAAVSVHLHQGLFASSNGIEVPLLYGAAAVALALTGPGSLSLDAILGLGWLERTPIVWSALFAGVIGAVVTLAVRRVPAPKTA